MSVLEELVQDIERRGSAPREWATNWLTDRGMSPTVANKNIDQAVSNGLIREKDGALFRTLNPNPTHATTPTGGTQAVAKQKKNPSSRKSTKTGGSGMSAQQRAALEAGKAKLAALRAAAAAGAPPASSFVESGPVPAIIKMRPSGKHASARPASRKPTSAKPASRKPVSAKPASRKPVSAKPASKKLIFVHVGTPKPASKKPASRKPASVARGAATASKKPATRKTSATSASAPKTTKETRKMAKKSKKPLSAKQRAALARGRATLVAKRAGKPASAKAASKKPASAHKPASAKASSKKKGSPKAKTYKLAMALAKLHAPKARKPKAPKKPSGKAAKMVPSGKYRSASGAQIVIRRTYAANPALTVKDIAVAGGGLFVGLVAADMIDRYVATMGDAASSNVAYHGDAAAEKIVHRASGTRMAVQGGATAAFGVLAYFTRDKVPTATAGAVGLAVGFGTKFLQMLVGDVIMPALLKAKDASDNSYGNRLYPDKQAWANPAAPTTTGAGGLPYGFRRPGYAGVPGFLGAPKGRPVAGSNRPFDGAPVSTQDVGPVATGAVGCGGGCGMSMPGRATLDADLGSIFPSAKSTCPSCRGGGSQPVPRSCGGNLVEETVVVVVEEDGGDIKADQPVVTGETPTTGGSTVVRQPVREIATRDKAVLVQRSATTASRGTISGPAMLMAAMHRR